MVARYVAGWRTAGTATLCKAAERIAPKHAAVLVTRAAEDMSDAQRLLFERIAVQCPEVLELRALSLGFRDALMKADDSGPMRQWIEKAKRSAFGPVVRFAFGLQKDISVFAAAVETTLSNGQVEGQINRLRTIKRQMYGRAGFELLRARVLPYFPNTAPPPGPAP